MQSDNVWELPFGERAVLELESEFGKLAILPVEPSGTPRVELSRDSCDNIEVRVDKFDDVVHVAIDPRPSIGWFGRGDCRAVVYVPRDVRAAVQTSAGNISVRDLVGCELAIKANAGKLDLTNVYGQLRLAADAGSINGRGLGGRFEVETHAGSVRLEILELEPGEHRVRASMGSVRLELARGMDLCIQTHTSMGSVRNNYPVRAQAATRLEVSTEMGSVRVEEAAMFRPGSPPARPTPADYRPPRPQHDDPELDRILKMVEAGELSAQDADELLRAMGRV
jgi:Putative adhesin